MKMDQDKLTAPKRATKISWNLIVAKNNAGEPLWRVQWRDSGDKPMMRAVGQRGQVAKLWPLEWANPYQDGDDRPKYDDRTRSGWERHWESKRRGRTARPDSAISYDDARVLARAVVLKREQEIDAERAQLAAGRGDGPITFGQLAEDYLRAREQDVKREKLKLGSYEKYKSMLRQPPENPKENEALILRALGDVPIADVTMKRVKGFLQEQIDAGKADSTWGLYRAAISGVLNYAVEHDHVERNVTFDLPRKLGGGASPERKLKFYWREQVEQIAAHSNNAQFADMIRLALYTGLRKSELASLRWESVNWTGRSLRVDLTMVSGSVGGKVENAPKSGKERIVPLGAPAYALLNRMSQREKFAGPKDRVFVTSTGGHVGASFMTTKWDAARDAWIASEIEAGREAPYPGLTFHSTRHTFGVTAAIAGVPALKIQGFMGHSDLKMTQRYLTYAPQDTDANLLTAAFGEADGQAAQPVAEIVES